jgi:hypothetical protein
MRNCNASSNQNIRPISCIACATALAVAFMVSWPQLAHADSVTPPPVPANIQVPAGNTAFLVGHAIGTQNYNCRPSSTSISGVAFTLFTPQATLFSDNNKEVTTHFFSPNPFESNADPTVIADGMIRAAWQHSHDTSTVWGEVKPGHSSSDPAFVAQGSIPWLLIRVVGAQDGPIGSGKLTGTTFIQRLNTFGGVAPSMGCASLSDLGNRAFVPYTADYFFYKHVHDRK